MRPAFKWAKLHQLFGLRTRKWLERVIRAWSPHPHTYYLIGRTKSNDSRPDLVLNLRTGQARRFAKRHSEVLQTSFSPVTTTGQPNQEVADGPIPNFTNDYGPLSSLTKVISYADVLANAHPTCMNCEKPTDVILEPLSGFSREPRLSTTPVIYIRCSTCGTGVAIARTGSSSKSGA